MVLDNLQDMLQNNLRSLLPMLLIVMVVVGNVAFAVTAIVPRWLNYEELVTQIASGEEVLAEREASANEFDMAEVLQHQITTAQTEREMVAADLLNDAQANQMLNMLFGYASESQAAITNLQAQQSTQAAPGGEYDIRVFRLKVEGDMRQLIGFITQVREASTLSVSFRAVDIQSQADHAVLMLETWLYVSPFSSGEALNDLPQVMIPTPHAQPSNINEVIITDVEPVEIEATTISYLAAPLPLKLLYTDTFDAGVLYTWEVGPFWSFVPQANGQALQVQSSNAPVTFRHDTLQNAAVQARFQLDGGSARLSLRESEAGSYTGMISPESNELRLYRSDVLVRSVELPSAPANDWYTVQLSTVDDIVRLVVNNVEYVAIRDLAQLPPGTTSFGLVGDGRLRVDDFMLWTPGITASPPLALP